MKNIFDGYEGLVEPYLFAIATKAMYDAVSVGFGEIEYGKPNFEFTQHLRQSGAWFSANKSYEQFTELAKLLDNGKGTKRSWAEFKKLAEPIVNKYNQRWLKTEYNTAIRSARIASQWKRVEAISDIYPNIEYVRTRSATPRKDHLEYVGIIRPINDPFWDTHTPPNGFNCKCSIRASDKDVTPIPENLTKVTRGLKNNTGKTGELFGAEHPYFRHSKKVTQVLQKEAKDSLAELDERLTIYASPTGKKIRLHPNYTPSDLTDNFDAAKVLADNNFSVDLPPHREAYRSRRPDFIVNGKVAELKEPASKNIPKEPYKCLKQLIDEADDQEANVCVFYFKRAKVSFSGADIHRGLRRAFINSNRPINQKIETIIIIDKSNKAHVFSREAIEDDSAKEALKALMP